MRFAMGPKTGKSAQFLVKGIGGKMNFNWRDKLPLGRLRQISNRIRFTIGQQVISACLLLVLAVTGINLYVYYRVQLVESGYHELVGRAAPIIYDVKDINGELWRQSSLVRTYVITGASSYAQNFKQSQEKVKGLLADLQKKLITQESQDMFSMLRMTIDTYSQALESDMHSRDQLGRDRAVAFLAAAGDNSSAVNSAMDEFVRNITKDIDNRVKRNNDAVSIMNRTVIVLDGLTFILVIAGGFYFARRLSRPLNDVVRAAEKIAAGDLTVQALAYQGNNEIGDLTEAFSKMTDNLRDLIRHLTKASEQVAAASQELSASVRQSAQGAERVMDTVNSMAAGTANQIAAVDAAAGTTYKMARAISQIFSVTSDASGMSQETAQSAAGGTEAVNQAAEQMNAINTSVRHSAGLVQQLGSRSQQIGEIVDVITGIAGQTNLLALNAAIEAARAGEQGRGFAVVADEVRKLAEQSQAAAGKIAGIIREIQTETAATVQFMERGTAEVEEGTRVITASGGQFKNIVGLIDNLDKQIKEIDEYTQELSVSGQEVVESVEAVKTVAGETVDRTKLIAATASEQTATMEEISASIEAMAHMAAELQQLVQKFKI
ncbi:chase3 [Lucifera butyrica]|uniref:Chase3 n=1 Tax=Lucifera butyrica TaxID=1351585 RepID=A0A498R670_9FIRM|nr:methyl-accepting chemotaxis protein [Lucifera butyrica]VBB06964.1 chase3 [Lucifera butyrica]